MGKTPLRSKYDTATNIQIDQNTITNYFISTFLEPLFQFAMNNYRMEIQSEYIRFF